jgi:hypothetical protein
MQVMTRLLHAVYDELASVQPDGLRYATVQLEDPCILRTAKTARGYSSSSRRSRATGLASTRGATSRHILRCLAFAALTAAGAALASATHGEPPYFGKPVSSTASAGGPGRPRRRQGPHVVYIGTPARHRELRPSGNVRDAPGEWCRNTSDRNSAHQPVLGQSLGPWEDD